MAKIININGQEIKAVSLDEARTFFRGTKGRCMGHRSFLQKIYRGEFPRTAYTKTTKGNYWFNEKYLLGFKEENTAA